MAGTDQSILTCSLCDARFRQRKNLMQHERTVHGNVSHKCDVCNASFNRLSILKRLITSHAKRPAEKYDALPNKRAKASVGPSCNWCGQNKLLSPNKPYCVECSQKGRECRNCRRPLPEKYYSRDIK